jgi:mannosyltransferase OCH1-like enzyme
MNNIPKIIHYCWFGENQMPEAQYNCIKTWKAIMPDYEVICWNENNFDINSIPFVAETCKAKKYGFTVDYLRLYALYNYGGIYLDTDVLVKRSFDGFLDNDFFSAIEYHPDTVEKENSLSLLDDDGMPKDSSHTIPGIGMLVAIMGSKKEHPFIKKCLDFYTNYHFILPNGNYNLKVAPAIYAEIATVYGFRYKNVLQKIDHDMVFYPSSVLTGDLGEFTETSYALHYCENSWHDRTMYQKIRRKLAKNKLLRKLLGKKPITDIDEIIKNIIGKGY